MSPYDWLPTPDDDDKNENDDRIDLTDADEAIDSLRVEGSQPTRDCLSPRIAADGLVYHPRTVVLGRGGRQDAETTNAQAADGKMSFLPRLLAS
jgi:hypothetical protein